MNAETCRHVKGRFWCTGALLAACFAECCCWCRHCATNQNQLVDSLCGCRL